MIYLSIPKGMKYKQINVTIELAKDYFIDPEGIIEKIALQDLVKEALKNNTGRLHEIKLKEFTIYLRKPPSTDEFFLKYTPNHNGKYSTTVQPELIQGSLAQNPPTTTQYGSFWFQQIPLSEEKMNEVLEARKEQSQNRRHTGSSPKAT